MNASTNAYCTKHEHENECTGSTTIFSWLYCMDGWDELLEELWDEEVDSWELEDPAAAKRFFLYGVLLLRNVVNVLQYFAEFAGVLGSSR